MKQLIPMNNYGLFADTSETARVDSRFVAQAFNKRHSDVLRDLKNLLDQKTGCHPILANAILRSPLIPIIKARNALVINLHVTDS